MQSLWNLQCKGSLMILKMQCNMSRLSVLNVI